MKQFHVFSDRKTIRELSWKDYMKMQNRKGFMSGWITDHEILFIKDNAVIHLSLEQLNKILALMEEAKP